MVGIVLLFDRKSFSIKRTSMTYETYDVNVLVLRVPQWPTKPSMTSVAVFSNKLYWIRLVLEYLGTKTYLITKSSSRTRPKKRNMPQTKCLSSHSELDLHKFKLFNSWVVSESPKPLFELTVTSLQIPL